MNVIDAIIIFSFMIILISVLGIIVNSASIIVERRSKKRMIERGSCVKIINPHKSCNNVTAVWLMVGNPTLRGMWDYFGVPKDNMRGVVRETWGELCYVEADNGRCYLMFRDGLKEILPTCY